MEASALRIIVMDKKNEPPPPPEVTLQWLVSRYFLPVAGSKSMALGSGADCDCAPPFQGKIMTRIGCGYNLRSRIRDV